MLDQLEADAIIVFFSSALGVVPTAALMGRATEELAHRAGPGIGGLLNVTFGNAPELIIALFALKKGLQEVVKASIIGSILGNLLLVMGAAFLIGGWGRERNKFVAEAAVAQATMLLLATVALVLPAMFLLARGGELPQLGDEATNFPSNVEHMSFAVAIVLLLSYFAGLWFSLKTHSDVFNPDTEEEDDAAHAWSIRKSVGAARGRRRRRRRHVRDPRRLDRGGLRGHRPLALLRLADHRRDRRQRGRALGRGLLRLAQQDGHRDRDRDRLERPDRAVRDARAGAAELRDRARSRSRSSSAGWSSGRSCSRC